MVSLQSELRGAGNVLSSDIPSAKKVMDEAADRLDAQEARIAELEVQLSGAETVTVALDDANKRRIAELEETLKAAQEIVDEQAEDERLWFIVQHMTEHCLQQELRRLHAAIEGKSPEECARKALGDS